MNSKRLALLAVLIVALGSLLVIGNAGSTDASTAPEGGSGTADDPYWFVINTQNSYELSITLPGTFSTVYAEAPATVTIPGMTFTSGGGMTFQTITTEGVSLGQSPSLVLSGNPESAGVYMVMARNPMGDVYTLIDVRVGASTNFPTTLGCYVDDYSITYRVFMGGQAVLGEGVSNPNISPHPYSLGFSVSDLPYVFDVTPVLGKSLVLVKVPRADQTFTVTFTAHLQQGTYSYRGTFQSMEYPNVHSITFDTDGGILSPSTNPVDTRVDGTLQTLPTAIHQRSTVTTNISTYLAIVAVTDYTFNGWYTHSSGGYLVTTSTKFIEDRTVYARYTTTQSASYQGTVVFNLYSDGESIGTETYHANGPSPPGVVPAAINTAPTKLNHQFIGWADTPDATSPTYSSGLSNYPLGSYDAYAVWEYVPPIHTVTFNTHGGSFVPPQSVEDGQTVTVPADPVLDGFNFEGWYTNAACTVLYDFTTPVTSDLTIHAGWSSSLGSEANPYQRIALLNSYASITIPTLSTFMTLYLQCTSSSNPNYHTSVPGMEFSGSDGTFSTIPTEGQSMGQSPIVKVSGVPTMEGTWLIRAENPAGDSVYTLLIVTDTPPDQTVYTISFDANGGSGTIPSQNVQSGNSITLPSSGFSRSGFYMSGWISPEGYEFDLGETIRVSRDMVLRAVWVQIPSGTDPGAPSQVNVGSTYYYKPFSNQQLAPGSSSNWAPFIAVMIAPGEGYHLVYDCPDWLDVNYNTQDFVISSTRALTASDVGAYSIVMQLWRNTFTAGDRMEAEVTWIITVTNPQEGDRFTISFDPNGGDGSQPSLEPVQLNNVVILPGYSQLGYTYPGHTQVGWLGIDEYGRNAVYFLGSVYTVTRDITLKAFWVPNPNVVVLDANGGVGSIDPYIAYTGSVITLPSHGVTRPGYTLAGWQLYQGSAVYAKGFMMDVEGAVHLQAYWIPDGQTTVTAFFNNNGGTGYLSQEVLPGTSIYMPKYGFTSPEGLSLRGWSPTSSGSSVFDPLSVRTIGESRVFYAVYQQTTPGPVTTHTVVFSAGEGVGSYPSQTVQDGQTVTRPGTDPVNAGHIFLGWGVMGGPSSWDFSTPVTESMVLVAQWALHYTLQTDGTVINITFAPEYSGSNNTVDWGDGTPAQDVFAVTASHDVGRSMTGTVTVTTMTGAGTVSSQRPWSTFGGAGQAQLIVSGSVTVHGDGSLTLDASGSSGFTSVLWLIDGEPVGQNLVVVTPILEPGVHEVILKATNDIDWDQWTTVVDIQADGPEAGMGYLLLFIVFAAVAILLIAFTIKPLLLIAMPVLIIVGWWLFG